MSISSAFLFTFVEKQFVMKQVLYKNDIYPYNVRVLLGADEEYIVKTVRQPGSRRSELGGVN